MESLNIKETLHGKKIDTANILNISEARALRDEFVKNSVSDTDFENKVVVITGVTGQDGSYMVDYLLKNTIL